MPSQSANVSVEEFFRQLQENAARVLKAVAETPLRTEGGVRYLHCADGSTLYGDGPAFLLFKPDGSVWWHLINSPEPDNQAVYGKFDALNEGRLKRDVYNLATLPTEDYKTFRNRTLKTSQTLEQHLEWGNVQEALNLLPILGVSLDYAVEANQVLQQVHDLLYSDDSTFERSLSKFVNCIRAARQFRIRTRRLGTSERNIDLTHGKFMDAIRRVAKEEGRVPFQAEIASTTRETIQSVRKKLKAIGANWIPAKRRGKDTGRRLTIK